MTENELLEEVGGLDSVQTQHLRDLCEEDLFFLASGVLGYDKVNEDTHGDFCLFITQETKLRRLALMPRAHLKSTLATVADPIRLTLRNPTGSSVLIVNEVEATASGFLTQIQNQFQQNQLLRKLYPELIPTRFSGPGITWNTREGLLPVENRFESAPHWRAMGVGGAQTGHHYHRIKADDLIGFEAARSPAEMSYAIAWNDNIGSLLVDQNIDIIDWIGTRWAVNDLYADIQTKLKRQLATFSREAIEQGKIIFPEMHTWDEYQDLIETKPHIWFAQYCNNPIAGGKQDLPAQSLKTFRFSVDGERVVFEKPDGSFKEWYLWELDRVMTVDPNSGAANAPDTAAIIVSAISPDDEIFVLWAWSARVDPTTFVNEIYNQAKRWQVREVGIEKAGQQNTQHYFEEKAKLEDYRLRVVPLSHGNKHKQDRVRGALHPVIASGRVYLLPSQIVLRKQITEFPDNTADIDDEVDAFAYAPGLWRKPFRMEDLKASRAIHQEILKHRSQRTGY